MPYKTLLLSVQDTAGGVVREMVEKYGLPKSEAPHYCLVQSNLSMPEDGAPGVVVGGGTTREYILDDDDCPLNILMNHQVEFCKITEDLDIWKLIGFCVLRLISYDSRWKVCTILYNNCKSG